MKITDVSIQARNPNRVNVSVDGKYRFSLDIAQVVELGIKQHQDYTDEQLLQFESESMFGKLYAQALEYCLLRPHSEKEVRDYLHRKTFTSKYRSRTTGEIKEKPGVSQADADRVLVRLLEKGYVDDTVFTEWWVQNRNVKKGTSSRKLYNELLQKGITQDIINQIMQKNIRDEKGELLKIIKRKRNRYGADTQKFIAYLARQGFMYSDIVDTLDELD